MAVDYIENSCISSSYTAFEDGPVAGELPESYADMGTVDSSAYVSGVLPLPQAGFSMSRLFENPQVLAADFRDPDMMADGLSRISDFVETYGGKLIPDQGRPGSGGEAFDLKSEDIARFFTECLRQGKILTSGELSLLGWFLAAGLLELRAGGYDAAESFVLIGMSRADEEGSRRALFVHEYSHALYFLDPDFQAQVSSTWASLPPEVQRFLRGALIASGYYASGEQWLIETETQAHAIGDPISENGLLNLMAWAVRECLDRDTDPACRDFWSYEGDLETLLSDLHLLFLTVSPEKIPMLKIPMPAVEEVKTPAERKYYELLLRGSALKLNYQKLTYNYRRYGPPDYRRILTGLQESFNHRHSRSPAAVPLGLACVVADAGPLP